MIPASEESPVSACEILLRRAARESDPRRRELMLRDCVSRSAHLPPAAQSAVARRIAEAFGAPPAASGPPSLSAAPETTSPTDRLPAPVDVLIVTVRGVEYRAALRVFGLDPNGYRTGVDSRRYHEFGLDVSRTHRQLSVVLTNIGYMGNVKAATAVHQMLANYQPGIRILCGIAAGRRTATGLVDVLIPATVVYGEGGVKLMSDSQPAPEFESLRHRIRMLVEYFDAEGAGLAMALENAGAVAPGLAGAVERPTLVSDSVVLAGEKLLRDGSLEPAAAELHRQIKLGDMESYGFASAVPDADWLVVRGVSDFGDPDKEDGSQKAAATAAAVTVKSFLQHTYDRVEDSTF